MAETLTYPKIFESITKLIDDINKGEVEQSSSSSSLSSSSSTSKGSSSAPKKSYSDVKAATLTGEQKKQNIKEIAQYLKSIGITREGAIGLIGNILGESQANPKAAERNSSIGGKGGIGIVQWTASRRRKLEAAAGNNVATRNDLDFQLGYLGKELKTLYKGVYAKLTNSKTSYEEATIYVLERFEVPGTYLKRKKNPAAYEATKALRISYAKSVISIIDEVYE
jgi:hypothetical protein